MNTLDQHEGQGIAIGLGTYKRPKMLYEALASLQDLILPENLPVSLIICDNNTDNSADVIISDFRKVFPFDVFVIKEERPGTVYYFNRILEKAEEIKVTYLAIFDDDETVDSNWLIESYSCLVGNGACAVQGRQKMIVPDNKDYDILVKHTSQKEINDGTNLPTAYGYNVIMDMNFVKTHQLRYHPKLNLTGGCDKLFFKEMVQLGGKIVYCSSAITYEKLPESRANVDWLYKRAYRIGHNNFTINKLLKSRLYAVIRAFSSVFSNLVSIILKPLNERNLREIIVSRNKRWAEIKGTWHAVLGRKYEEYKVIHGN